MKSVIERINRRSVASVAPSGSGKDKDKERSATATRLTLRRSSFSLNNIFEDYKAPKANSRCGRLCQKLCMVMNWGGGNRKMSPFRAYINRVVKSTIFSNFILGVIFLNSVLITLQMVDSTNLVAAYYFDVFDKVLMGIYILELSLKLYAHQERFVESGWNLFDAFIVSISIVETVVYTILNNESSISPAIFRLFRVFKALRAMRAIRAISFLKNLQVIIVTLLKSIPAMGSIILLLLLILYIFAIIFVTLYRDIIPNRFGTLWVAMFSLFQVITLDDWSEYYYLVYEKDPSQANTIMMYMMVFIVLETFICINLFIAVIVNNLERANMRERQRRKRRMEAELAEKEALDQNSDTNLFFKKKRRRRKKKKRGKDDNEENSGNNKKKASEAEESEAEYDSNDDDELKNGKRPSDTFIYDPSIPHWQREIQPEILALLASLDRNSSLLQIQQHLLDDLVDASVRTHGPEAPPPTST